MAFWVPPKTWAESDTVTDEIFNSQVRDGLAYLLNPPSFFVSSTGVFTTTSTSFAPVDSTFTVSIVTGGGKIVVGASGLLISPAAQTIYLAIGMDGGSEQPIARLNNANAYFHASLLFNGLGAGQHTPTLRWQVSGGTGTLRGADGGGFVTAPIIFWAIEI